MRAVIYARYSSELQSRSSIEDQVRNCKRLIEREGWTLTQIYSDHAISGTSMLRPGYQRLVDDARNQRFDVVVSESIDRLSRDQEHIAAFYKLLSFRRIPFVTLAEGEISELHIGLKGTMSALYLKDLAQKTHRGLEGRIRQGRSAGGRCYGYDVVRNISASGLPSTGERRINPYEAEMIRRIFKEFAVGKSPRTIAASLNREGVAGPRGTAWGASTIYGNWRRGTGLLNNELYIGKLVWNRQSFVKDPETGKRQARPNPLESWISEEVPDLQIIDDDLWNKVKSRQEATRQEISEEYDRVRSERARRPRYLFSGKLRCGACGGGYILVGKQHYGCANVRNRGTCGNRLTFRRDLLEKAVLYGLKERLLHPTGLAEYIAEYLKEWNSLQREKQALKARDTAELARIDRQIGNIVEAIKQGLFSATMKAELEALETRKAALQVAMKDVHEELPRLHPGLADIYQKKVQELTEALSDEDMQAEAANLLRSLLQEIRLIPENGALVIELVGELAAILAFGQESKRPHGVTMGARQIMLVAGAGFEPAAFRL